MCSNTSEHRRHTKGIIRVQQTQTEKSYHSLRQMLTAGAFNPGDQLVNRQLASQIGVSLGPLREAINRLASEGLVNTVPGAGSFVRKLSRRDLEELYILREAVESCAAAEAVDHISPVQLDQLEAICDEWFQLAHALIDRPAALSQMERWLDYEKRYHEILLDASRNQLLAKVVRDHRAISQVFNIQRQSPELLTSQVAEDTVKSHRALVDALRRRDPAAARELMSQQIRIGRKTVLEYFDSESVE